MQQALLTARDREERATEIEATNDRAAMRELIELLVHSITVQTEAVGTDRSGRTVNKTTALLRLAFANDVTVVSPKSSRGSKSTYTIDLNIRHRIERDLALAPNRTGGWMAADRAGAGTPVAVRDAHPRSHHAGRKPHQRRRRELV